MMELECLLFLASAPFLGTTLLIVFPDRRVLLILDRMR